MTVYTVTPEGRLFSVWQTGTTVWSTGDPGVELAGQRAGVVAAHLSGVSTFAWEDFADPSRYRWKLFLVPASFAELVLSGLPTGDSTTSAGPAAEVYDHYELRVAVLEAFSDGLEKSVGTRARRRPDTPAVSYAFDLGCALAEWQDEQVEDAVVSSVPFQIRAEIIREFDAIDAARRGEFSGRSRQGLLNPTVVPDQRLTFAASALIHQWFVDAPDLLDVACFDAFTECAPASLALACWAWATVFERRFYVDLGEIADDFRSFNLGLVRELQDDTTPDVISSIEKACRQHGVEEVLDALVSWALVGGAWAAPDLASPSDGLLRLGDVPLIDADGTPLPARPAETVSPAAAGGSSHASSRLFGIDISEYPEITEDVVNEAYGTAVMKAASRAVSEMFAAEAETLLHTAFGSDTSSTRLHLTVIPPYR